MHSQGELHQLLELLDIHLYELVDKTLVFQELTLRSQERLVQFPIVDVLDKGYELALGSFWGE